MWQPIETAPKDGSSILIAGGTCMYDGSTFADWLECSSVSTANWDKHAEMWCGGYGSEYDGQYWHRPTHWMPLPTPPGKTEQATVIPMGDCGLSINCGTDGTWLHFTASNGHHASINVDLMDNGGSITKSALRGWCADRQEQAKNLRGA